MIRKCRKINDRNQVRARLNFLGIMRENKFENGLRKESHRFIKLVSGVILIFRLIN